jgi:mycothiol synthase
MAASVVETIEAVRAACLAYDGQDPLDEAAALALKHHGTEGADVAVVADGFALVRGGELTLAVAPQARRQGLAARLLSEVGPAERAWSHGDHPGAAALAARRGWRRTRDLWVMRRPTSLALPELVVPDGVRVRGYRDDDAEQWWDPAGLIVAASEADGDRDEVLAFHWTKQHDATLGEVYVVAVGPAAQGRGLGRVVTLAGLHHLAGLGVDEVLLYVESDNAPAVRLYGSLGFEHAARDTHVQYSA